MDCAGYQRWLSAHVDGQLTATQRAELQGHLSGCARCAEALASLRTMLQALRAMETPAAPPLLPGIHARLARRPWWQSLPSRLVVHWPLHGLALATGAVLIVIVVWRPAAREREYRSSADVMMSAETVAAPSLRLAKKAASYAAVDRVETQPAAMAGAAMSAQHASAFTAGASSVTADALHAEPAPEQGAPLALHRAAERALANEAPYYADQFSATQQVAKPLLLLWIRSAPSETIRAAIDAWLPSVQGRLISATPNQLTIALPAGQYAALREQLSRFGQYYDAALPDVHVHTDLRSSPPPATDLAPDTLLMIEIHLLPYE